MHARTFFAPALGALAAAALALPALADEPCPHGAPPPAAAAPPVAAAPAHGGRILTLCDSSFELVHDMASGTCTIYALPGPAPAPAISSAPLLVLPGAAGPREVPMTSVQGTPGSWQIRDDDLKGPLTDAKVRMTIGGRSCEAPLMGVPTLPLTLGEGDAAVRFEMVHDAREATLFFAAIETPGKPLPVLEAPFVLLTTDAGPRRVALVAVEGRANAWRVADEALRAPSVSGSFGLTVAGKPLEAPLPAAPAAEPAPAPTPTPDDRPIAGAETPPAPSGPEQPAMPAQPEPSAWGGKGSAHDGPVVVVGAARMQMRHDPADGRIAFEQIVAEGAVEFDEPPVLVLTTSAGTKEFKLRREKPGSNLWFATIDDAKNASTLDGTLKARIGGQEHVANFHHFLPAPEGQPDSPGEPG